MQLSTDTNPVFYRQLGMDDVEYRLLPPKRPGEPFDLLVRSRTRPELEAEFPVEDPHAPVTGILFKAQVHFANMMEKEANDRRAQRRATQDERARTQREILEGQKRQSFGEAEKRPGNDDEVKKPADKRPRKKSTKRAPKRTKKG